MEIGSKYDYWAKVASINNPKKIIVFFLNKANTVSHTNLCT